MVHPDRRPSAIGCLRRSTIPARLRSADRPPGHMGTRTTRTTPVRTARPEPPFRQRPFVSALSMKPVQAGCPRPVVRFRGRHRPSRPPRDALAGRNTIAHATPGRTSVHPGRPRWRRPLQHRPDDPGRRVDHDGGPADHPDRQGPDRRSLALRCDRTLCIRLFRSRGLRVQAGRRRVRDPLPASSDRRAPST